MHEIVLKITFLLFILIHCLPAQLQFRQSIKPDTSLVNPQFTQIAVFKFGDLYLLEKNSNQVWRIDRKGKILDVNGGYGWGEGLFDYPTDLSLASGLNVLVADFNNHRLQRFDRYLNFLTQFPVDGRTVRIEYPLSVAASNLGEIFVLEWQNNEVVRFDTDGGSTHFGGVDYGRYALIDPVQLRLSKKGNVTVLESNGRLLQFDRFGTPIGEIVPPDGLRARGMVLMGKNVLLLNEVKPYLVIYAGALRKWLPITLLGSEVKTPFVSGAFSDDLLLLLDRNGTIYFYGTEDLDF